MFFFRLLFFCVLRDDEIILYLGGRHSQHRFFFHLRTVCLGCKHRIDILRFLAQSFQGKLGSQLLALLLGVTLAFSALYTFHHNLIGENRASVLVFLLSQHHELQLHAVFLAPFDEFALEVHLLVSHLIDVYHFCQDALLHEFHTGIITTVQINGTNQRFESISSHIAVMRTVSIR